MIECRRRCTAPKPGKSPKKVGDADTPKLGRLLWCTHCPPVRSLRIQNGCGSMFEKLTLGVRFHVPWKNAGSANDAVQSSPELKVRA